MASRRRGGKAAAAAAAAGDLEAAGEREPPRMVRHFTWDERRQLALDVCSLAAPDVPGALLLARNYGAGKDDDGGESDALAMRELPLGEDKQTGEELRREPEQDCTQLRAALDLDAASDEMLQALRAYVDACFLPALSPRPQCAICQGLWSCGRVVACANDACGLRVHEECFGVLLRARGDAGPWRCPSCLLCRELLCAVCMQTGGALKPLATAAATAAALGAPLPPTASGSAAADAEQKWVHVLCALAIPELLLRDVPTMEPVDGFDEIENGRFRYLCSVCRKRGGASVICEHEACNVGMHPQCAADAGLMIGTEDNLTGVFCEKHLPLARVPGATRWISDEDLVEEIMSEYSLDEDLGDDLLGISAAYSASPGDRYAFILESTPFLARKLRLFGRAATSHTPPAFSAGARLKPEKVEITARDVRGVYPGVFTLSSDLQTAVKKQQMPVFPPRLAPVAQQRLGLPPFPQREAAVGAIVEYFVKEQDAWERAHVLQWDPARAMHVVQLVRSSQRLYAALSSANTLVLYLPGEENLADGVRVKLYRPWTGGAGDKDAKDADASRQWRPKPRQFASSSNLGQPVTDSSN